MKLELNILNYLFINAIQFSILIKWEEKNSFKKIIYSFISNFSLRIEKMCKFVWFNYIIQFNHFYLIEKKNYSEFEKIFGLVIDWLFWKWKNEWFVLKFNVDLKLFLFWIIWFFFFFFCFGNYYYFIVLKFVCWWFANHLLFIIYLLRKWYIFLVILV